MFIHFAFARLKHSADEQIDALIKNILARNRLIFSRNPEFFPVFQPHIHPRFKGKEVYKIALESFKATENGATASLEDLKFVKPQSDIYFLPYEIGMICFIKTSLKQLRNISHSQEYGKLGLVFEENFLKRSGTNAVQYYREELLFNDPLIIEWNLKFAYRSNLSAREQKDKKELETKILAYRKPASLFESFRESRMLATEKADSGMKLEIVDAYSRYPIGYDFQGEKEWRIISYDEKYLKFSENDLYMVIVPDEQSRLRLEKYFGSKWKETPELRTFPLHP